MRSVLLLPLLLLAGICSANITPITIDNAPSVVQVEAGYSILWIYMCVGNVITSFHILSAGRCFDKLASVNTRRIRAGASKRFQGGELFYLSTITLNEEGDLAVVRLARGFTFSDTIQARPIAAQGTVIPDNVAVSTAAWGYIGQDGLRPIVGLRRVSLVTVSNEDCQAKYDKFPLPINITINADNICAGDLEDGGFRVDPTDAGAPLFIDNAIIGVQSFGNPINKTYPVVMTSTGAYSDWIVKTAV